MNNYNKRVYKRPKNKTLATTNPNFNFENVQRVTQEGEAQEPQFALLAKDSEWINIFPNSPIDKQSCSRSDGEEVLHVDSEDRPQTQPIALMFPGLSQKHPEMLEGIVNKVMSTTEITKHLVGQKANFACMKKVGRLIPIDKVRGERVRGSYIHM
ncbi:unnamed protein product, partial [Brenthis ino]